MALLYERYGADPDIEEKPEWTEVMALQLRWIKELGQQTGSTPEVLVDQIERAISTVFGDGDDIAVSLSHEQAGEIVRTIVDLALASEAQVAQSTGAIN